MNILLVSPKHPRSFWSFKYSLQLTVFKKATHPPLGLLTVASMIPDGWNRRLVDMNVQKLKNRDIEWADYVFISASSIQRASLKEVIERCKEADTRIVAGGPLFPTEYEEFEDVDHLILGEAEVIFPKFLEDLKAGRAEHIYSASEWADLTETPVPAWELLNMRKYISMCIQYSRGCPYDCDFCDITKLYGRKVRTKSVDQIIMELESLRRHGWSQGVFFVDDNFIGNKLKLKREVLPAIIDWVETTESTFSFNTQVSIDLSDDEELMDLMYQAGFDSVFVGIETPAEEGLDECSKMQNKGRDMVKCVKKIQEFGLQVQGGFIVGFDSDTPSIFSKQIEFIQNSEIVTAMVGILNVIKGTDLYKRLAKENRLSKTSTGDNTDYTINFKPNMSKETLLSGYKKIVQTIYSPKKYYDRVERFLKRYKPRMKGGRLNISYFLAFVNSIWVLGILGKERLHYWKLFFRILFTKPKVFPLAIVLSINGFHFRKVFERI